MSRDLAKIQKELGKLERKGIILPEDVVSFAKNPRTALHRCFTWDDGEAAGKWRLEEARRLIRCYVVVDEPSVTDPVRAFVALKSDRGNGGGYRRIVTVMNDAELHAQLMSDALDDLRAAQRKYARLKELQGVFREIDKVEKTFQKKRGVDSNVRAA